MTDLMHWQALGLARRPRSPEQAELPGAAAINFQGPGPALLLLPVVGLDLLGQNGQLGQGHVHLFLTSRSFFLLSSHNHHHHVSVSPASCDSCNASGACCALRSLWHIRVWLALPPPPSSAPSCLHSVTESHNGHTRWCSKAGCCLWCRHCTQAPVPALGSASNPTPCCCSCKGSARWPSCLGPRHSQGTQMEFMAPKWHSPHTCSHLDKIADRGQPSHSSSVSPSHLTSNFNKFKTNQPVCSPGPERRG